MTKRGILSGLAVLCVVAVCYGDEPRKAGVRDSGREGGDGGNALCVVPLGKVPEADVLAALEKVFGKQLKITVDKDLKIIVLQGPDAAVAGAVQGLKDCIDTTPPAREVRRDGDSAPNSKAIDVVQLRKAKADTVTRLIKQYVSDKVEITERPNVSALIIEGDRGLVIQAAMLARQIDGQILHPSLRRKDGDGGRERER